MLSRVFSCAVIRLDGVIVEVEVDAGDGLPGITIVGLLDAAVHKELPLTTCLAPWAVCSTPKIFR